MTEIKVDLAALESFASQLEERLAALTSSSGVPGVGAPLPVGGEPAYEGQALSDAYWYAARDAQDLLDTLRSAIDDAVTRTRATVTNYRGDDQHGADSANRNDEALQGGGA